ncbi:hypothetical protein AJ80_09444 [Polytolypa hystricis UAMH7299]|uniref:MBOAT family protein n=1 Tax=Polytolypa hystricis (strain UAMH7299) TaxID=1447883 RepID=A0A2B7WQF8_POLH7|nr:hypothetical protein AJ80_09444 [Polytolypa hystricis UAMH7299]
MLPFIDTRSSLEIPHLVSKFETVLTRYAFLAFKPLADATGASVDELKLIASFLLSYPLAGILKRLPDSKPWQKNLYIIGVSTFYLVVLFDLWDGLRTLLYSAVGAYTIAYYVDGSLMPWIGFMFLMGHMSLNHITRQIINEPSVVDVTGAQMVLVMKLSAFCWNVHDGRLPKEQLSEGQRYAAIEKFPSILDYAGYVFFFPSLFAGPAFDFVDYRRWIETTMFDSPPGVDPSKVPPTRKKRKIPRSGKPAMIKAAIGILWILAFIKFSAWYNTELVLGDQYMEYGFLRRVWIMHMLGFTTRLKYYGVWMLTEGACILSGMGYNGFDPKTGKVNWDRLENVNPYGLETAQNPHGYLSNWNKNTNHWLRNYVYLRVTPRGKKPGFRASLATFSTSAFWHGFYPGYYLAFILGSFVQTNAKHFRRNLRPFFLTPDGTKPTPQKRYYDILSWFITQVVMSFAAAPFIILRFNDCITAWSRVYFYGIIGVAASMAFFASPAKAFLGRELKAHTATAGGGGAKAPSTATAAGRAAEKEKEEDKEREERPPLGLPDDISQDIDDAVQEIRREIEGRRRRGSVVTMPTGQELKTAIEARIGRKF